ncbi:MAG: DUF2878 domain-containing protein [Burkholderiaceae bacterium]|nr:DUF2878 domain-containing protein [Burkholderiaceae bacterium]
MPARARMLIGLVVFQVAWFACVIFAAQDRSMAAVSAAAAAVAWQVGWSTNRVADVRLVFVAIAIGVAWDSALAQGGLVDYASPEPLAGWAPAWILAMWALFASVLREPMQWLHGRPALAAVFGAIGGPASYLAAERMGACRIEDGPRALGVLAIGWALATPLLLHLAQRFGRPPARLREART